MPVCILIVDDHRLMSEGLLMLLQKSPGNDVAGTAADCAGALKFARERRPDLVLMDVDLPDGSGIELTRQLRREFPAMKVVILTAHLEPRVALEAMEAGACGFLNKTNAATELNEAVRVVMAGGIYAPLGQDETAAYASPNPAPASPGPARISLPARESQVLVMLFRGLRNKEIAAELGLSEKTVETYRSRLMKRFGCKSLADLIRTAIRQGLIPD